MTKNIKDKCPNYEENDPNIELMEDGSCGVCAGSGYIILKDTGLRIKTLTQQKQEAE